MNNKFKGFQPYSLSEGEEELLLSFDNHQELLCPELALEHLYTSNEVYSIICSLKEKSYIKGHYPLKLTKKAYREGILEQVKEHRVKFQLKDSTICWVKPEKVLEFFNKHKGEIKTFVKKGAKPRRDKDV